MTYEVNHADGNIFCLHFVWKSETKVGADIVVPSLRQWFNIALFLRRETDLVYPDGAWIFSPTLRMHRVYN
jgi:hypothetical protein